MSLSHSLTLSLVRPEITSSIQIETPENVSLEHRQAGVGTRFLAWFHDQVILFIFLAIIGFILVFVFAAVGDFIAPYLREFADYWFDQDEEVDPRTIVLFIVGVYTLLWGFSSFVYFTVGELFWRGQTPGKKANKIRVIKVESYSLDPVSIFVRNIFRVADNIPLLWVVPLLSSRGQRLGDMVAGTYVISEDVEQLPEVRSELSERKAAEATFRFDHARLGKLTRKDYEAIERILDRWDSLKSEMQLDLLDKMVPSLCRKLQMEEPSESQRVAFLEDLLAAEYRRQDRKLR